jgi:hypothetical protein
MSTIAILVALVCVCAIVFSALFSALRAPAYVVRELTLHDEIKEIKDSDMMFAPVMKMTAIRKAAPPTLPIAPIVIKRQNIDNQGVKSTLLGMGPDLQALNGDVVNIMAPRVIGDPRDKRGRFMGRYVP